MDDDAAVIAYRQNIVQVVDMVFQTMLGLQVEPYPMPWARSQSMITAVVYFVGAWDGAVLLECTPSQACQFVRLLMGIDPPDAVNDDVRDAVGELANMLAGNMKSVLPTGVVLSIPLVVEGSDYTFQIGGKRAIERVPFWCEEGVFAVTLVEKNGATAPTNLLRATAGMSGR